MNDTAQTKYTQPPPDGKTYLAQVQIATTRSTITSHEKDIKELLLSKIASANKYVYMENVQITDPDIAKALYRRKNVKKDLDIVIVCTTGGGGRATARAGRGFRSRSVSPTRCSRASPTVRSKRAASS